MSTAALSIRLLDPRDAQAYRALRCATLRDHPEAFTSSFEDELQRPPGWAEQRLEANPAKPHDFFLGALRDGVLVGMVGLEGRYRTKERHNATVLGMMVAPEARSQGVGAALMQALLARARHMPGLEQLDLTVTEGNRSAQQLYERCGFVIYGVLKRAIQVDGHYHAKVQMALLLASA